MADEKNEIEKLIDNSCQSKNCLAKLTDRIYGYVSWIKCNKSKENQRLSQQIDSSIVHVITMSFLITVWSFYCDKI